MRHRALAGDHIALGKRRIRQALGKITLLAVGKTGKQFHGSNRTQAAQGFAPQNLGLVRSTFFNQMDGVVVGRKPDAVALQGGKDMHTDIRIRQIIRARVDQPVTQDIAGITRAEIIEYTTGCRRQRHIADGCRRQIRLNQTDHPPRRHRQVDIEINAAPPHRRRLMFVTQDGVAALHQLTIRHDHLFASARQQGRVAPLDVSHLPGEVIDPDPVADLQRAIHLQRKPAQQIAQRILHGKSEHGGDHR